jgi:two-component system, OmpR family, phosphate regulon sensor histidine kinase PhoR
MLTSHVFWRVFLVLGLFVSVSILIWEMVCGSPPAPEDAAALGGWRVRCALTSMGIAASGMMVSWIAVSRFTDRLHALTRGAEQLAGGALSLELPPETDAGLGPISAVFQTVSQHVTTRLTDLQNERFRLEQSHDRLAIVLEAMVEGVIAIDREQRILLANTAAMRLLDFKGPRLVEQPLWEAVRLPPLQELVKQTMSGAEQRRVEIAVPWTQSMLAAVVTRLPGDPCPGAVIVLHDVTDLRRLENLRREFVSNVSHELKTPLAAISAYAETLLDGALDDPNHNRGFVTRIGEQAERLNTLIIDLLELARVEADEHALEIAPVEIGSVLRDSIEEHRDVARSKNLRLTAIPASGETWGLADAGGLRTVIDNLIDNAINYTPDGGRVDVRWSSEGDRVCFEVSDSGVGIAKEHQARIFERFFRVDRARSRAVGGTGLGLSIVKHFCQAFDAEIKLTSRLGHGSTFSVRLRASEPAAHLPRVEAEGTLS